MKGLTYGHDQWPSLIRFLHDGRIREISNNGCERALRSLVIGRNNWQWFGSETGTKAALVLMTLLQSCREHRINPLLYLADVLREVSATPASKIGDLTPRRQRAEAKARESRSAIADVVRALTFTALRPAAEPPDGRRAARTPTAMPGDVRGGTVTLRRIARN